MKDSEKRERKTKNEERRWRIVDGDKTDVSSQASFPSPIARTPDPKAVSSLNELPSCIRPRPAFLPLPLPFPLTVPVIHIHILFRSILHPPSPPAALPLVFTNLQGLNPPTLPHPSSLIPTSPPPPPPAYSTSPRRMECPKVFRCNRRKRFKERRNAVRWVAVRRSRGMRTGGICPGE